MGQAAGIRGAVVALPTAALMLSAGCTRSAPAAAPLPAPTKAPSGSMLPSPSQTRSSCYPSRLHVSSLNVRAGGSLTLSSAAFACQASYPAGKTYSLTLVPSDGPRPANLGSVPVNRDGSFKTVVRIPSNVPAGHGYLLVRGSAFDQPCDDGESGSSCASYGISVNVQAAGIG